MAKMGQRCCEGVMEKRCSSAPFWCTCIEGYSFGARYRVHMKIYLLTVLYLLTYDFYISAKQSWQVDATEQILQDWSARVCSLGLFSIWISGPTISVAKCCVLSFCKTKGSKHLDGKKRCTYWQPLYKYTFYYFIAPYIPIYFPSFHLFISSWKPTIFSMNLYTSSIIHVQLHPSSSALRHCGSHHQAADERP